MAVRLGVNSNLFSIESMRPFKLTMTTLFARKAWILAWMAALVLPLVLPYITPWEANVKLIEPARAQVAWSVAWLVAILWTFTQGARLGEANSRTGIGAYFRSAGISRISQLFQIWAATMLYLLPVVVIALGICLLGAMPANPGEVGLWVATNFQYAALFLLTVAPLGLLAVALGSRFGALVGYVAPVSLCLYGLYGVGYLGQMIKLRDNALLEWIYAFSPHYHLADLTPRLVFKMGSYPSDTFGALVVYFFGLTLVLAVVSGGIFRTDPLRN